MKRGGLGSDLALAWRLARREARGGLRGFGVFLACLALGVGAACAVGLLAASLEAALAADARRLAGGDLEVRRAFLDFSPEQDAFLAARGRVARLARLRARVTALESGGEGARAALAEVKAVDGAYPLLGRAELAGGGELAPALAGRGGMPGAVAEPALLARLGIEVGEALVLGQARFVIMGELTREPDRAGGGASLGPRLIIGLPALAATGLLTPDALVYHLRRLLLPPGRDPAALKAALFEAFPSAGWQVRLPGDSLGQLRRVLANLGDYLLLVSLAALLVGGVGVAGAVRAYLAGKTRTIAILKCLGATRRQALMTYLIQVLGLALAGGLGGGLAGLAAAGLLAGLLAGELNLSGGLRLAPAWLLAAPSGGVLLGLACVLPALSAAAAARPARLLRGFADPGPGRATRRSLLIAGLLLAACLGLAALGLRDARLVLGFSLAAGAGWLALAGLARLMAALARRLPRPADPRLALALANLRRPGGAALGVLLSLGLGLAALVAVTQVQGGLERQLISRRPARAPSFFFLGIPRQGIEEFRRRVLAAPGVEELVAEPSLRGRIVALNGVPAERVRVDPGAAWALESDRGVTFLGGRPPDYHLTAGEWWPPDYAGPPLISFEAGLARGLGLKVGDTLTLNLLGREMTARIANLREIDWRSLRLNHAIVFAPGALEGAPYAYLATVRVTAEGEAALLGELGRAFPNVAAVGVRDALEELGRVVDRIALAVRVAAWFCLLAGVLVLAQSLRADLAERHREAVVLKVFGATRRDLLAALVLELLLLGGLATLLACLLGSGLAYWFGRTMLQLAWAPHGPYLAACALGGPALALALGLWGVRTTLLRKSWAVLRGE